MTTEEFIIRAREVHGDKYDYSLTIYDGALKDVKIIYDNIIYDQLASSHLCGKMPEYRLNTETFITKAKKVHGDKYNYDKLDYVNSVTNVIIILDNIEYLQNPSSHLSGCCPENLNFRNTEEYINDCKKIHGNRYDYSKTIFSRLRDNVIIICHNRTKKSNYEEHGEFSQNAQSHIMGNNCAKCVGRFNRSIKMNIKTQEQFIDKSIEVHGDKYDYSLVDFTVISKKVKIIHNGNIYMNKKLIVIL
jgi:hypothetical protein